jgi:hypothetical protein
MKKQQFLDDFKLIYCGIFRLYGKKINSHNNINILSDTLTVVVINQLFK